MFVAGLACRFDIRPVLFGGVQGFFKGDIMAAEEPPQARRTFLQIVRVCQPCLDLGPALHPAPPQ
jgi:hypothetical protein